jgi:hypothetical protein
MKKVKLGSQGLEVPAVGLGCMGMTAIAGADTYGKGEDLNIHNPSINYSKAKPTYRLWNTGKLLIDRIVLMTNGIGNGA